LVRAKFSDTEITSAEAVAAGAFTPSDQSAGPATIFRELQAFCHVVGIIRPTMDSEIGFEVWLPADWNGRYLQIGNGGFGGSYFWSGLKQGLQNGFAVAGTDDGHTDTRDASWALRHPEKVIDYGYRAVHLTSMTAKLIVATYYGNASAHAYFSGCSDGGREGLMEVQRYPGDFDGWIIGAPGNDWTGHMTEYLRGAQVVARVGEPLTTSQLEALSKAAIARCDAADGIKDGVIDQPLKCTFDPGELQCKGAPNGTCLSAGQATAVRKLYDDVRDDASGASLAPGWRGALGTEIDQWPFVVTGPVPANEDLSGTLAQFFSQNFWSNFVYQDPKLDFEKLNLLQAFSDSRSRVGTIVNAVDPNLSAARASGKKIIQYHGWADSLIPAQYSISYYEAVEKYLGRDNRDFYRLFLVPGMEHCGGGPGPNVFGGAYIPGGSFDPDHSALAAIVRWVEHGTAPERIIATKYLDDDTAKPAIRTRPLCPYPKVARWTGKGTTDNAANFECSSSRRAVHLTAEAARGSLEVRPARIDSQNW
jgi:feruloyl esterase